MASGLSVRYTDGVEDSRNPKQATRQAWIKLIVKVWAYWQAKSAVYVNELDARTAAQRHQTAPGSRHDLLRELIHRAA